MGYLKKDSTVCNPAKKSLTVFQNSYTQSTSVPVYGYIGVRAVMSIIDGVATLVVSNDSDVPIEWRSHVSPSPRVVSTVTLVPHNGISGISIDGTTAGYGDLYTQAGAYLGKAYGNNYRGNAVTGYTTQYSTKWNTKWRKLSA